jgi:hypothetical protein
MATIDVFVSQGRTSTPEHDRFMKAFEDYLRQNGLNPRMVGRNEFSTDQPLKHVERVMGECAGTAILAYERLHIERGTERRGSSSPTVLADQRLPTVWNQIEAGMAYAAKHPLFVVVEEGLRDDGLLQQGYDWFVLRTTLSEKTVQDPAFVGVFADWRKKVEAHAAAAKSAAPKVTADELEKIPLSTILRALSVKQWVAIVGVFFAVAAAIATGSFWLATHQPVHAAVQ